MIGSKAMNRLKQLSYFFLPLPFAAGALADDKFIRIGYKESLAATNFAPAVKEKIAQLNWYFAHASVGDNMMEGIAELRAADKNLYPIKGARASNSPPPTATPCSIYEHNRGNPGWKAKFDLFETCVRGGWHSPRVNIAMNKLCFIDQGASFKYYIHSMTNLEAEFPQTVFVYTTIPLTTSTDGDNFLRNAFNDRLRDWTRQNGRVLFDIADIESHDAGGGACTFAYRDKTCQRLCDGYTTDGGHLNSASRQLVARGFYALAAALLEANRTAPATAKTPPQ